MHDAAQAAGISGRTAIAGSPESARKAARLAIGRAERDGFRTARVGSGQTGSSGCADVADRRQIARGLRCRLPWPGAQTARLERLSRLTEAGPSSATSASGPRAVAPWTQKLGRFRQVGSDTAIAAPPGRRLRVRPLDRRPSRLATSSATTRRRNRHRFPRRASLVPSARHSTERVLSKRRAAYVPEFAGACHELGVQPRRTSPTGPKQWQGIYASPDTPADGRTHVLSHFHPAYEAPRPWLSYSNAATPHGSGGLPLRAESGTPMTNAPDRHLCASTYIPLRRLPGAWRTLASRWR